MSCISASLHADAVLTQWFDTCIVMLVNMVKLSLAWWALGQEAYATTQTGLVQADIWARQARRRA